MRCRICNICNLQWALYVHCCRTDTLGDHGPAATREAERSGVPLAEPIRLASDGCHIHLISAVFGLDDPKCRICRPLLGPTQTRRRNRFLPVLHPQHVDGTFSLARRCAGRTQKGSPLATARNAHPNWDRIEACWEPTVARIGPANRRSQRFTENRALAGRAGGLCFRNSRLRPAVCLGPRGQESARAPLVIARRNRVGHPVLPHEHLVDGIHPTLGHGRDRLRIGSA